jgi:hypothetical protein
LCGGLASLKIFFESPYRFLLWDIIAIVASISIKYYNNVIFWFTKGMDYVSIVLASIEKRNSHLFKFGLRSPYETEYYN